MVVTVRVREPLLTHRQFIVSCDNHVAVTVINSVVTRDPFMQHCLRQLCFTTSSPCMRVIRASLVPGEHYFFADTLSRWDLDIKYQREFNFFCSQIGPNFTFIDVPNHLFTFQVS